MRPPSEDIPGDSPRECRRSAFAAKMIRVREREDSVVSRTTMRFWKGLAHEQQQQ